MEDRNTLAEMKNLTFERLLVEAGFSRVEITTIREAAEFAKDEALWMWIKTWMPSGGRRSKSDPPRKARDHRKR